MSQNYSKTGQICHFGRITVNFNVHIYNGQSLCQHKRAPQLPTYQHFTIYACVLWGAGGSLTPFSKTKQFYLLIDFLLKVFFLSNSIRIFVALYGTIAL